MNFSSSIHINRSGVIGLIVLGAVIILVYRNTTSNVGLTSKAGGEPPDTALLSLRELLSAAVDAAERGGNEVRHVREAATLNMQSKGKTAEGINDPVTDGDMKSHIVMFHSLQKAFPNLEIISEEHDLSTLDSSDVAPANYHNHVIEKSVNAGSLIYMKDVKVWIDPLDATKEYTEDLRKYVTTMVGVAVKGVPTIGVVHRPFSNVTHWGWVDHGLSPDLADLKKKQSSDKGVAPASPRIIVSISHQGTVKDFAKQAFGADTSIIPAAGAGYKIMEVIENNADAYVHTTAIKKWDLCAGHALLRSMGGSLTTLSGMEISYDDRAQFKNDAGLLATLAHHKYYIDKLEIPNKN